MALFPTLDPSEQLPTMFTDVMPTPFAPGGQRRPLIRPMDANLMRNVNAPAVKPMTESQRATQSRGRSTLEMQQYKALLAPLDRSLQAVSDLKNLLGRAERLDQKGLLPKPGATAAGVWLSSLRREWQTPTDEDLVAFQKLLPSILIGVDRGYYGEVGVRSIRAFEEQLKLTHHIPSLSALRTLFGDIQKSIQRTFEERVRDTQAMTLAPSIRAALERRQRGLNFEFAHPSVVEEVS